MQVFEIKILALHFPRGHLGTMGEQRCALNGLPRFINKKEINTSLYHTKREIGESYPNRNQTQEI